MDVGVILSLNIMDMGPRQRELQDKLLTGMPNLRRLLSDSHHLLTESNISLD